MKTFVVNGKFMADRMQGIVRYGREILNSLDPLLQNDIHVILAIPPNAKEIPHYTNIEVITLGNKSGILWEQFDLRSYMRRHKDYTPINFCNVTPFFIQSGITVIHDIMYKTCPDNYRILRNKISRLWHCIQYSYIAKHEKKIVTVSNYSKKITEKSYPVISGKVEIISPAWQHVLKYKANIGWQNKYPFLRKKEFFLFLATLAKNKNVKWVIETARKNSSNIFAVAGMVYDEDLNNLPNNIKLLGFIPDEDACALMHNCRAFLFPSLYEGFGLPPLEALVQGAEVISSNTTSMPEVLGKSVHYIDPYDYDVDLEELLKEKVEPREKVLEKFGWDKSAKKLLKLLQEA